MYNRRFPKLTRDICWKLAKECSSRSEFTEKYYTAAAKASEEGWITDYTWLVLKHERRLTRERCYELAKDCHTRKELNQRHPGVMARARKEGWINDYTWLVSGRVIKHTYNKCVEIAKKYTTVAEFRKNERNVFDAAYKKGWLSEFTWLSRAGDIESRKNDNVYVYEFTDLNAVYIGRTVSLKERNVAHHHDTSGVARFAKKYNTKVPPMKVLERDITIKDGLIREDYWVKQYERNGWRIINTGKTGLSSGSLGALGRLRMPKIKVDEAAHLYSTLKDFREKSPREYEASRRHGWINSYTWLARERVPHNTWTYRACYDEAKKYSKIGEFRTLSPVAYHTASHNGWITDYTWLGYCKVKNGTWSNADYDTVKKEAVKYTTRNEFMKNAKGAWRRAKKQGWLDTLFPSLRRSWSSYADCKQEASKYSTRTEFAHGCNSAYYSSIRHGWINEFFPKIKTYE